MSTTGKIMLLIEQHRTAGGRVEHQATKERLNIAIDALVTENETLRYEIDVVAAIKAERDELLVALRTIKTHGDSYSFEVAEAAIAKATGEIE